MAEFNQCAHLMTNIKQASDTYDEIRKNGGSPFNELLKLQNSLQHNLKERLGRTIPPDELKTKGELVNFLWDQKHAFDDEFMELINSIAGSNKPEKEQSAVWKKWKSNYDSLSSELVNEGLTETEIHERNFECIDMLHFVFNVVLSLGLSEKEIFEYYYLKNQENFNRYKNGY